jgi:hypothetical protein
MAIEALEITPSFSFRPAHKLYLARMAGVSKWIRPALEALAHTNVSAVTMQDVEHMGPETFLKISHTRGEVIDRRARQLVSVKEPVHDRSCTDHKACRTSWVAAWRNFMAYFAGATDTFNAPISEQQLHEDMKNATPPMRPSNMGICWETTIGHLDVIGFFDEERNIIYHDISSIMRDY